MISALKRWTKMGGEESKLSMPSGVKAMGQALQRKFARGVQYNMKIVIKGDRNTGKTCMFHRLQGRPFSEHYIPTNEIQAGSIHWNYRATDDIVKVDVWDVVDVGKSKKSSDSLKLENDAPSSPEGEDSVVADANFVDVYKGTHGVIMVMDITKPWTFNYIKKELPRVPAHIPVLVLGNHRDMEEHRLIVPEDVTCFIQSLERPDRSPPIHYAESSMKNGFGLKYIHTFLNFPFLLLQREALLQQLQVNAMDMESTLEELQIYKHTEEQDYDKYLEFLDKRMKEREAKIQVEKEAAQTSGDGGLKTATETTSPGGNPSPEGAAEREAQVPVDAPVSDNSSIGAMKRWFSGSKTNVPQEVIPKTVSPPNSPSTNVDEFQPEDELDAGFLNDETSAGKSQTRIKTNAKPVKVKENPSDSTDNSDSDYDSKNPMVSGFTEDISDEEDSFPSKAKVVNGNLDSDQFDERPMKHQPIVEDIQLTSSEEEDEEILESEIQVQPKSTSKNKHNKEVQDNQPASTTSNRSASRGKEVQDNQPASTTSNRSASRGNDFDDWLDSPELEPKVSFNSPAEEEYSVRKVDVNSPLETQAPTRSIGMDEWSIFMQEQMKTSQRKPNHSAELVSDGDHDDRAKGDKHHKKSGEKSKTKKHKKHKEKTDEGDGDKERHKHKQKHKDNEDEHRSKTEENEKKKKSKHRHSKRKSTDESKPREGKTYEEL